MQTACYGRRATRVKRGVVLLGAPFRERSQVDLMTYAAAYRFSVVGCFGSCRDGSSERAPHFASPLRRE